MLFVIDQTSKSAKPVAQATLGELMLRERFDLQEWVLASPELLGDDLLIITTEFDRFDKTSERLDILAVDRNGKLVVIELKRTAVGTKADLQSLRYAAYCSTLGIEDVAEMLVAYKQKRAGTDARDFGEAIDVIRDFVEEPEFEEFDDKPRIILAAEEFPPEITATLLWLRSFDIDISAVRITPYQLGETLLVDCAVLIPLPEAKDFIVLKEQKDVRANKLARGKNKAYLQWFQVLIDELRETHKFTNARMAQPQNWYSFASGYARVWFSAVFTQHGLRVEVYIDRGEQEENKRLFDALYSERMEIEAEFGSTMSWERLDNRRASRVGLYRETTINSPANELQEAREWAIDRLLQIRKVFEPRLRQLIRP